MVKIKMTEGAGCSSSSIMEGCAGYPIDKCGVFVVVKNVIHNVLRQANDDVTVVGHGRPKEASGRLARLARASGIQYEMRLYTTPRTAPQGAVATGIVPSFY